MDNNSISLVVDNYLCSGCGACKVICPTKAIIISKTAIGRLYASINNTKCIDCGICLKVCPSLDLNQRILENIDDPFKGSVINTYTGISCNERIYKNSQSGGLVTETITYLFDVKKIDAAIVCKSNFGSKRPNVSYEIVTDPSSLYETQRSIYTPVDMLSALENVSSFLSVAFVGLPCHIQGLYSLQSVKPNSFKNIKYKLGLICERSLSEVISDLLFLESGLSGKKTIYWKDKRKFNYKTAPIVIENQFGEQIHIPSIKRHFLKNYLTAPRCYICFDKMNIYADIVFGDPWGMRNINWTDGESLVISRNVLGDKIITGLIKNNRVKLKKGLIQEAMKGQGIDLKKSSLQSYVQIFEKNNWLVPQYVYKLGLPTNKNNTLISNEKKIKRYLTLEQNNRDFIIMKLKRKLKVEHIKRYIYLSVLNILRTPIKLLRK